MGVGWDQNNRLEQQMQSDACCSPRGQLPLVKLKGQKQQSGLGGPYTMKLSPKSRAEKRCKEGQHSTNCYHQTKEAADAGTTTLTPPPPSPPTPAQPPVAHLSITSSLSRSRKMQKPLSSVKWSVVVVVEHTNPLPLMLPTHHVGAW